VDKIFKLLVNHCKALAGERQHEEEALPIAAYVVIGKLAKKSASRTVDAFRKFLKLLSVVFQHNFCAL